MMNQIALLGMPGWVEILIVLVVLVVLFGAARLPEIGRSLGRSIEEFKRGRREQPPEDGEKTSRD